MPYAPTAIANYFLDIAESKNAKITPMKMQKLVYFAHGWYLALKDAPLLDEQVEAWSYGPVIPSLYRELSEYGDQPITRKMTGGNYEIRGDQDFDIHPDLADVPDEQGFVRKLLDRVWEIYSPYTAIQLSNITHESGTPWDQVHARYTQRGVQIPRGTDIPPEFIRDYFRSRLRPNVGAE